MHGSCTPIGKRDKGPIWATLVLGRKIPQRESSMRTGVSGNESDSGSGGPIHANTSELLVLPQGFEISTVFNHRSEN